MVKTVWEARFFTFELVFTIFVCIVLICLSIYIFIKKPSKYTVLIRSFCSAFFISSLLFLAFSLVTSYQEWNYMQNHKTVVEGTITDFSTGQNGTESFYVNGVLFSYPTENGGLYGYATPQRDGFSVINGNGQYVRLTYYYLNGVNNIVKIESLYSLD